MKRITFKNLARIPAIDVSTFVAELANVFVEETGIDRRDPIIAQIMSSPDNEALGRIDWKATSIALQERVSLPADKLSVFMSHVLLLVERAIFYPRLYYALSGTKLLQKNVYPFPPTLPIELQGAKHEFMQTIHILDEHLRYGLMMLNQFQLLLETGASISTLSTELQEAQESYYKYLQTRNLLDERYGFICWYCRQVKTALPAASHAA